MPITKSAKKKIRQDNKRQATNERVRAAMKKALRTAKRNPTTTHVRAAYVALDTAAKKRVIHANKAARLKSRLRQGNIKTQKPVPSKVEGSKPKTKS